MRPCKRGHRERYGDGRCVICRRECAAAWKKANPERCRAGAAAWWAANKDEMRASAAKYRAENRDKIRASNAADRAANKDKFLAREAAYRKANTEKVRARNAAWQKATPAAHCANQARRNARKINAPGRGVPAEQWRNCLVESLGLCAYCNERRPLTMDHIEPLNLGGEHDIDNIAAVCGPCNSSKGDTQLLVWLAKKALLRKAALLEAA